MNLAPSLEELERAIDAYVRLRRVKAPHDFDQADAWDELREALGQRPTSRAWSTDGELRRHAMRHIEQRMSRFETILRQHYPDAWRRYSAGER